MSFCVMFVVWISTLSKLKYHKISHSASKKHECTWCSSKFGQKSDRTSSKVKIRDKEEVDATSVLLPFTCAICHQCFKDRESVSKDMGSVHQCTSIYTCLDCSFTFAHKECYLIIGQVLLVNAQ